MGMTCSNSSFVGYPILLLMVAPVAAVALALNQYLVQQLSIARMPLEHLALGMFGLWATTLGCLGPLAMVNGWTPWGYQERIDAGQIELTYSDDLRQMIRQALKKDTDGAYFNVVVATHYLDNIRARPGALIFDAQLPHSRGSFKLSTLKHAAFMQRFDRFLSEQQPAIVALKSKYKVEANLEADRIGLEQWKLDFIERKKLKDAQSQ